MNWRVLFAFALGVFWALVLSPAAEKLRAASHSSACP
jgi:hypothetical protein